MIKLKGIEEKAEAVKDNPGIVSNRETEEKEKCFPETIENPGTVLNRESEKEEKRLLKATEDNHGIESNRGSEAKPEEKSSLDSPIRKYKFRTKVNIMQYSFIQK